MRVPRAGRRLALVGAAAALVVAVTGVLLATDVLRGPGAPGPPDDGPEAAAPGSTPSTEPVPSSSADGTGTGAAEFGDPGIAAGPGWERTAVAGQTGVPDAAPVTCPPPTVAVRSAEELHAALAAARPGSVIGLENGTYTGEFVATTSGTAEQPVFLCGGPGAVLDGGDVENGYVVHLAGARHWRLVGFVVTNGQKGVMADGTVGSVVQGLTVTHIGDEAIHLRRHSTDNVVRDNTVSDTGNRREKFGEGVYVGSAESNWCDISDCEPDRSDRNVVVANTITGTTSESVDVKEGTTGGVVAGNTFDGARLSGADSWVDVKGNAWLVEGNRGSSSPEDGFQTHEILPGWGDRNLFRGNVADVDGPGHGFALRPALANRVTCDNEARGAAAGLSNVACVDAG